jgi:hypothetical protein
MHRWEDDNRMDLRETGWEVVDWIHVAQNRDQWLVVGNEPSGSVKSGEFLDCLSDY